jgi:uncharacterized repeat protein (TIGR03806 family)
MYVKNKKDKMSAIYKISFFLFLSFILVNCEPGNKGSLPVEKSFARVDVSVPDAINTDVDKFPLSSLSEYGFFDSPLASLQPRKMVLPYEPITSLFTDYAFKKRFVWMPEGAEAQIDAEGVVQFPLGTILIKHFYYPADFSNENENWDMMETRLLIKSGEEWKAYSYVWNEDDSDAFYNPVGDILNTAFVDKKGLAKSVDYAVPNKNQCKSCHNRDNIIKPLGPIVQNLDKDVVYPDGKMNQVTKWQSVGYLAKNYVKKPNHKPLADWQDKSKSLEERSLAYLQVNCGHCHRENGSAHTTGLFLLTTMEDRKKLGICKTPVAAGKGAGNLKFDIQPGQPEASILLYRMKSEDPGVMMPELGRMIKHEEGIQLISDWIASMPNNCEKALQP